MSAARANAPSKMTVNRCLRLKVDAFGVLHDSVIQLLLVLPQASLSKPLTLLMNLSHVESPDQSLGASVKAFLSY